MTQNSWTDLIKDYDERRNIAIPGDADTTIRFCVDHFLGIAQESIDDHGYFAVALSGGSTPKAIYEQLAKLENRKRIDWSQFLVFWSDERCVEPTSSESNYHMADNACLSVLPIPKERIFRMEGEKEVEESARFYEQLILNKIPSKKFDLVLLGVGEDGHTASLFPHTHGLHAEERLVIANYIPEKNAWRLSLTYSCINEARHTCIYALGKSKASILTKVLGQPYVPDDLPSQRVGTTSHKALWILDTAAASNLAL